jgi:hypothetical protein
VPGDRLMLSFVDSPDKRESIDLCCYEGSQSDQAIGFGPSLIMSDQRHSCQKFVRADDIPGREGACLHHGRSADVRHKLKASRKSSKVLCASPSRVQRNPTYRPHFQRMSVRAHYEANALQKFKCIFHLVHGSKHSVRDPCCYRHTIFIKDHHLGELAVRKAPVAISIVGRHSSA